MRSLRAIRSERTDPPNKHLTKTGGGSLPLLRSVFGDLNEAILAGNLTAANLLHGNPFSGQMEDAPSKRDTARLYLCKPLFKNPRSVFLLFRIGRCSGNIVHFLRNHFSATGTAAATPTARLCGGKETQGRRAMRRHLCRRMTLRPCFDVVRPTGIEPAPFRTGT